jgi:hypothetical protein
MYQQIPYELDQRIKNELEGGEMIEWKGMPVPRFFKIETTVPFLFAIPWTAFAIFWMFGAAGFQIPDLSKGFNPMLLFPLFGLPFVLIGIAMLSSPIWSYLKDKKTVYVITDRRLLIMTGGRTFEFKSIMPDQIKEMTRRERADTGDLVVAHKVWRDSDNDQRSQEIGLFNIPDVRGAQAALQRLLENFHKNRQEDESNGWELKDQ